MVVLRIASLDVNAVLNEVLTALPASAHTTNSGAGITQILTGSCMRVAFSVESQQCPAFCRHSIQGRL